MEIFKSIMLMILKMIIDAMSGGLTTASTKVEAGLASSVAKNLPKTENSSTQKNS